MVGQLVTLIFALGWALDHQLPLSSLDVLERFSGPTQSITVTGLNRSVG